MACQKAVRALSDCCERKTPIGIAWVDAKLKVNLGASLMIFTFTTKAMQALCCHVAFVHLSKRRARTTRSLDLARFATTVFFGHPSSPATSARRRNMSRSKSAVIGRGQPRLGTLSTSEVRRS